MEVQKADGHESWYSHVADPVFAGLRVSVNCPFPVDILVHTSQPRDSSGVSVYRLPSLSIPFKI